MVAVHARPAAASCAAVQELCRPTWITENVIAIEAAHVSDLAEGDLLCRMIEALLGQPAQHGQPC